MSKKEMVRELVAQLEEDPGLCAKLGIEMDEVGRIKKLLDDTELSDDELKDVSGGSSNPGFLHFQQLMINYNNNLQMASNLQRTMKEMVNGIIQNIR